MKSLFTLSFMLLFTWTAIAQSSKTPTVNLKKVLTLKPSSYESGNGATVVWHPGLKRYFTSRAGNAVYPLDLFSAIGRRVSDEGLKTMFDVRGVSPFTFPTNQLLVPFALRATVTKSPGSASIYLLSDQSTATSLMNWNASGKRL